MHQLQFKQLYNCGRFRPQIFSKLLAPFRINIGMDASRKKDILKRFGAYLRHRREKVLRVPSVRQLATDSNLDHSKLSKIEKGMINMRFDTLLELAIAYKMHPRELFQFPFDDWDEE